MKLVSDFAQLIHRHFQSLRECVFAVLLVSLHEGLDCRVSNRPVTRAPAQIAGKLVVKLILRADVLAVVALEHRKDESRRAITALRPMTLNHLVLHRMQLPPANQLANRCYLATFDFGLWTQGFRL